MDAFVSLVSMHKLFYQQKKYAPLCYQQLKLVYSFITGNNGYEASDNSRAQEQNDESFFTMGHQQLFP